MQETAEEIAVPDGETPFVLFAAHESFNPGVVGLTASRLSEKYYRPAIVGHRGEETIRASCRSIAEFHITEALDACADMLVKYGGHAAAAGFTVRNENVERLVERLKDLAERKLDGADLRPTIEIDAVVSLEDLTMELLKNLELLQPTGQTNPEPMFAARGVEVRQSRRVGREDLQGRRPHLKLRVGHGAKEIDAIAFRQGDWHDALPQMIDLAFEFEKNEFRGRVTPQLNVRDIRPAG